MCICYGWVVGYGHACFFFFKQKTAYEMRISDWSSDVCSSDLRWGGRAIANQSAGSLHDRASETPAASVAAGKTQAGGGGRLAVKKAGPAYCPMTRRWCEHESRKDLRRGWPCCLRSWLRGRLGRPACGRLRRTTRAPGLGPQSGGLRRCRGTVLRALPDIGRAHV